MKSGIYIYTFKSGRKYIGQALDIEARWVQHTKKMQSGKHTKLIQNEYDKYGLPDFRVLMHCHPCHLDWLEADFIKDCNPTLNTVKPQANIHYDSDNINTAQLLKDTPTLIKELESTIVANTDLKDEISIQYKVIRKLEVEVAHQVERTIGIAIEKAPNEIKVLIEGLREDVEYYEEELDKRTHLLETQVKTAKAKHANLEKAVFEFNNKPWYVKLFGMDYTV